MTERDIVIHDATPDDMNFVRSSWMRTYRDSAVLRALGPAYGTWRVVIDAALASGVVRVARPMVSAHKGVVVGWACIESACIHYAYVRESHRGLGICRELTSGKPLETRTHALNGKFDSLRYVAYGSDHGI
jgi:hypothetical protein